MGRVRFRQLQTRMYELLLEREHEKEEIERLVKITTQQRKRACQRERKECVYGSVHTKTKDVIPRTRIRMDLSNIDPQLRVLNYF